MKINILLKQHIKKLLKADIYIIDNARQQYNKANNKSLSYGQFVGYLYNELEHIK